MQYDLSEISGALARGYCSEENKNKEVDATLLQAQLKELEPIIQSKIDQEVKKVLEEIDIKLKAGMKDDRLITEEMMQGYKIAYYIVNNK